jgi:hydroquinone glucosyltransferase
MENGDEHRPPHVAMLATPGMGHLIPLAELAKRLSSLHGGITTTLVTFASTASATQRAFLASLPPTITSLSLPPVDLSDLPRGAAVETRISEECARSVPALTALLAELRRTTPRLVAFVADLLGADAFDAAAAAGVPRKCLFFAANLHALTLLLHLPWLDASVPEPLRLPGCVPFPGRDVQTALQDRSDPCYRWTAMLTPCSSTPSTPSSRAPPRSCVDPSPVNLWCIPSAPSSSTTPVPTPTRHAWSGWTGNQTDR